MNRMNAFSQKYIYKLFYIECFFGFDNYLPFIQVSNTTQFIFERLVNVSNKTFDLSRFVLVIVSVTV